MLVEVAVRRKLVCLSRIGSGAIARKGNVGWCSVGKD